MTRGDRAIVVGVALLALLAWPVTRLAASGSGDTVVIDGPAGRTTTPLASDAVLDIDGASGPVAVTVAGGSVSVMESSCPGKLCVRQGAISRAGEAIVCVPNGVTVRIGGDADALDCVVR